MNENAINAGTIARTIVLALALLNMLLQTTGHVPIDLAENTIYQAVSDVWLIGSTIWAWWKNNSFTKPAIEADNKLKELKEGK